MILGITEKALQYTNPHSALYKMNKKKYWINTEEV